MQDLTDLAYSSAYDRTLADSDLFQEWVSGQLVSVKSPTELPHQVRSEVTPEDFKHVAVAHLFRLALDPGQHNPVRIAAIDAIRERYTQDHAGYMSALALDLLEKYEEED